MLRSLLAEGCSTNPLPHLVNESVNVNGVDGTDIELHKVMIGLEQCNQGVRVICFDNEESRSTACEFIKAAPSLWVKRLRPELCVVTSANLLDRGVRMPSEASIE